MNFWYSKTFSFVLPNIFCFLSKPQILNWFQPKKARNSTLVGRLIYKFWPSICCCPGEECGTKVGEETLPGSGCVEIVAWKCEHCNKSQKIHKFTIFRLTRLILTKCAHSPDKRGVKDDYINVYLYLASISRFLNRV